MWFKQVGIPARTVLRDVEMKRASEAQREMGGGLPGEDTDNPPVAQAAERATTSKPGMRESAGTEAPASDFGVVSVTRKPSPSPKAWPVLRDLTGGRGMDSARSRNRGRPAPALSRPMLLVVGGRDHHAATG